jgi:alkanesulfonate monooxygenase SsuD/methylene tetrahydromethanopterin reductase-like flavin-dependent oxidoreductase (luciferase family)
MAAKTGQGHADILPYSTTDPVSVTMPLARLAERGKLDGIFLADIVGVYDVYRGGPAP